MSKDSYLELETIGRCRIISRIGEGGTGSVYRGHHDELDLDVAIKFLHPHLLRKPASGDRFLREARLAARLNHPSIVRVFDCGDVQGNFYIIMEHVDGESVDEMCKKGSIPSIGRALEIAEAVAGALNEAHSQLGMIHRDVKPANVLISTRGEIKLVDLGLAKIVAHEQSATAYTSTGVAMGTPNYMSPEQFEDASEVDHRSDIYGLGATLFHMVAGEVPYEGESFVEIYRQVTDGAPKPLPAHVPVAVDRLIAKMLGKHPDERFETYDELIEAIREVSRTLSDTDRNETRTQLQLNNPTVIPEARIFGRSLRPASPKENRVLIVVDIQNDFCPDGALGVPEGDQVVPLVNKLSRRFAHVILTQDWHCEDHLSFASSHPGRQPLDSIELSYGSQILWPDHCVQGTRGADFHPELEVSNCELVIRKGYHREIDSYSAFFENDRQTPTGLAGYLRERGLTRIFLAGLATDFCVAYTALDARRLGFEVTVIEEACRGIDVDGSLSAAWEQMLDAGAIRA